MGNTDPRREHSCHLHNQVSRPQGQAVTVLGRAVCFWDPPPPPPADAESGSSLTMPTFAYLIGQQGQLTAVSCLVVIEHPGLSGSTSWGCNLLQAECSLSWGSQAGYCGHHRHGGCSSGG